MSQSSSFRTLTSVIFALTLIGMTVGVAAAHGTPTAKKHAHVLIWDFFPSSPANTPERVALRKVAAAWAKKTGNSVADPVPPTSSESSFIAGAKSGKAADIIFVPDDQMGVLWGDHLLANVKLNKSKYVKQALAGVTIAGKQWAYPWALETMMLYYNKHLISSSQMSKLTTWDKVAAWSKSFHKKTGAYGIGWQWDNVYYGADFLTGYPGSGIFAHTKNGFNTKKVLVNSSGTIKSLEYLKSFINKSGSGIPAFMGNSGNNNYPVLFEEGKEAICFIGPWGDGEFKGKADYGVQAPPKFPNGKFGAPFLGVQTMAVNKYSKNLKAAESLAAYLNTHMELPLFNASGRIPAIKSVLKQVSSHGAKAAELKQYSNAFKHTLPLPDVPQMGNVWTPLGSAMSLYLNGKESAKKALDDAAAAIKKADAGK